MAYGFQTCRCSYATASLKFIIFCTVHQMSRLYDQILYTVINSTLQCLIHIIDFFTIPCLHMVDDDLRSKCTVGRPSPDMLPAVAFSTPPISCSTAVVKGSTKAYDKRVSLSPILICI